MVARVMVMVGYGDESVGMARNLWQTLEKKGRKMARHELLAQKLSLQTYFADPHSPWQRGSNENTNGLLRQYLPKGINLAPVSQRELNVIAERLNNRPRMTPNEAWTAQIQSLNHFSLHLELETKEDIKCC